MGGLLSKKVVGLVLPASHGSRKDKRTMVYFHERSSYNHLPLTLGLNSATSSRSSEPNR